MVNPSEINKENDKVKYRVRAKQFSFLLGNNPALQNLLLQGLPLGEREALCMRE